MHLRSLLLAAAVFLAVAASAPAAVLTGPVTNPANGHDYYLLTQDTWTNSEAQAVALGGHLATINDAAENAYVFNAFATFGGTSRNLWIGLNDVAAEGTFVWTSGETVTYTNWASGQPDNFGSTGEDYAYISGFAASAAPMMTWNDVPDSGPSPVNGGQAFGVVEVVPEPAAAGLLGAAGLLALLRRRRPKQQDGRGKRIVPLAVAGCVGTVVAASAPVALGQNTTVVATTGQASPSGPGSFTRFSSPDLNNVGQVAFFTFLGGSGVDATNNSGIYRGDAVTLTQIARSGQAAPSGPGNFDTPLFQPNLNDSGQVAFLTVLVGAGTNNDNNTVIYRDDRGTLTQIARGGQAAPAGAGNFRFVAAPSFNNAGQAAFLGGLGSVVTADDSGIYRGDGTNLTQIARARQAAPSGPGAFTFFAGSGDNTVVLNEVGQVAFVANLGGGGVSSANDSGIYRGDGTNLTQIARKGQTVPSGPGSFTSVFLPSLNDAGQTAFGARLGGNGVDTTNDGGIYRGDGVSLLQIVREGQVVPVGPGNFVGFTGFGLNDAGQTAFFADLGGTGVDTANNSGVYRGETGEGETLTQIARAGQTAPTGPGNYADFGSPDVFDYPAINDVGQVAFLATLSGSGVTSGNNLGLYLYDDSLGLLTVAREGDSFLGSTISALTFASGGIRARERSGLNDVGQIAYSYTLANGNSGIAVFSIPEPSSLALLGLGGFTLLRRRRPKQRDGRGKGIVPLAVVGCVGTLVAAVAQSARADLFVSSQNNQVLRYDDVTGASEGVFASGGGLRTPLGLAFGPDGDLFVADVGASQSGNHVLRYDGVTGASKGVFASGFNLSAPSGLVFGPSGDLFVSFSSSNVVGRFDGVTGASKGSFANNIVSPQGLVFGPGGDLFVASSFTSQVFRYDGATGAFEGVFASGGGLNNPRGVVFGPEGDLFVSSTGSDQVLRYDGTTGASEGVFASGGGLRSPQGVVFGPDGDLFVSSVSPAQVLRYDGITGAFEGIFASGGGLSAPTFLVFNPIPEPSSLALLGLSGLALLRRRRGRIN